MASATVSTLFRQDVLRRQDEAAFGETIRIVPLSHTLLAACLVAIIAVAIVYAAFAGYSRKETVQGLVTPSRGVIRIVAPRAGMISELLVAEGDSVSEDQVLFRVISEETNAAGTGSDTAILEAIKQQKAILEDQIRNESRASPSPRSSVSTRRSQGLGVEVAPAREPARASGRARPQSRALIERIAPLKDGGGQRLRTSRTVSRPRSPMNRVWHRSTSACRRSGRDCSKRELALERQPIDAGRSAGQFAQERCRMSLSARSRSKGAAAISCGRRWPAVSRACSRRSDAPSIPSAEAFDRADRQSFRGRVVLAGARHRLRRERPEPCGCSTTRSRSSASALIAARSNRSPPPCSRPTRCRSRSPGPPRNRRIGSRSRSTVRPSRRSAREVALQPDMTLRADIILESRSLIEWLLEPL